MQVGTKTFVHVHPLPITRFFLILVSPLDPEFLVRKTQKYKPLYKKFINFKKSHLTKNFSVQKIITLWTKRKNYGTSRPMDIPLENLLRLPDDYDPYEPAIERAPMERLLRRPASPHEELQAKAKTTAVLMNHGMQATINDREETTAMHQFNRHIQQLPIQTSTLNKPGIILKLTALMSEYDYQVVKDATQMRQYITNRLLEESKPDNPQRMRALELLGKITDVGLFTERTEVTVKTMPIENLEAALHDRLITLLPTEYEEVEDAGAD